MKILFSVAIVLCAFSASALETQAELAAFLDYQDQVEIQASKLAIERSSDAKILAYANRVFNNHILANRVLVSLVKAEGLTLGSFTEFDHELAALLRLHDEQFNRAYARLMVNVHTRAVDNIDKSQKLSETPVGALAQIVRARVADGLEKAKDL